MGGASNNERKKTIRKALQTCLKEFLRLSLKGAQHLRPLIRAINQKIPNPASFKRACALNKKRRNILENMDYYLSQDETRSCEDIEGKGFILGDKLRLRKGPGTDYEVITELSKNSCVTALGVCDNDWYLVNADGQIGFVRGDYLRYLSQEYKKE